MIYGWFGILVVAGLVGYYFLTRALSQTNQVLVVWEKIAETPLLGNYVGSIFTMLMKLRNPFSRSIRTLPYLSLGFAIANCSECRLSDHVVGSRPM